MTTQPNVTSTAITRLGATPPVRPTAGQEGGVTIMYEQTAVIGPTTTGDTTGGLLRGVRIPSNAIVKQVLYCQNAATTTATFSFGTYYSNAYDGTSASNVAASATAIMATLFGSSIDTHASPAAGWVDTTFANSSGYLPTDTVNPIWQAANGTLTTDPGGFIDICALNTATISGAATLLIRVIYTIAAS